MPHNIQFWAMHPDAMRARADVSPLAPADGVARLMISGPVPKDPRPGAVSWVDVCAFIAAADRDPAVTGLAFIVDSGGGAVAGMQSAAYALRKCGKPSLAFVVGACGSAVFYFGSACSLGIWAQPLSMVGGVGVYIPIDTDPADPAIVSAVTPAKHLPDTDPRAKAAAQQAADDLAAGMLSDMASWKGLPDSGAAALFYGEGAMFVATRAASMGMIAGLAMEPPLHLFNPAGLAPAIPGGAPMPGADARAEVEGLTPEALAAEPVAEVEVEAEAEPDYAAMTPEERAAMLAELQAKMDAIKAVDEPAAAAPDPEARAAAAAAFSRGLVDRNLALPAARAQWEKDYIADPDKAQIKAAGLKPALHVVPKGDARREPAPAMAMTGTAAVAKARAFATEKGLTFSHAVGVLSNSDPAFKAAIKGA